jgi:hypothetical protein
MALERAEMMMRSWIVLGFPALAALAAACGEPTPIVFPSSGGSGPGSASSGGTGGIGGSGGSGGDTTTSTSSGPEPVPPFRTPNDLADPQLALAALQIMGANIEGASDGCIPCHSLTEAKLKEWTQLTNAAFSTCLTHLDEMTQADALEMIECVRLASGGPDAPYSASTIGFWSSGAQRDWWSYTFRTAYPIDGFARWTEFVDQMKMPPGPGLPPLSEADYDLVGEWFVRGAPLLDELLDEEPQPGECDALASPAVAAHVTEMQTAGWRAVNTSNTMLMYGCAGAPSPIDCLAAEPDADPSWLVPDQGTLKHLYSFAYPSSFWTRISPDGRYVGHGRQSPGFNAAIIDLQAEVTIPVDALYDPAFFPDNSGFVFQGGSGNVCAMSVLSGAPAEITMDEPGCAYVGAVGLYQHVGAALGGGDYFAVDGPFVSDNGGHDVTLDNPGASFGSDSAAYLVPMVFGGTTFSSKNPIQVPTPFEADASLSPSARLLLSRSTGLGGEQKGYTLRRIDATPDGTGGYTVSAPTIARYCIKGGKPGFSYDERWLALHHYVEDTVKDAQDLGFVDNNDPGFAGYRNFGAANIYLVELATGKATRITNMAPRQYALFPSFRNDGWLYFAVRTSQLDGEYVVASDAALVAEGL